MKKTIALIILLFSTFCVVDGFFDLLIYTKKQATTVSPIENYRKQLFNTGKTENQLYEIVNDTYHKLKRVKTTIYGTVPIEGEYGTYTIGKEGQRLLPKTLQNNNANKKLLILGSSQTFGYLSPDKESFAAQLAQRLPDYKIDNYSGLPQTTHQSLATWIKINETGIHYDVVVVINGPIDIVHYINEISCIAKKKENQLALFHAARKIKQLFIFSLKIKQEEVNSLLITKENPIVQCIKNDYLSIVDYGKKQKSKTYIFIPPTPYNSKEALEPPKETNQLKEEEISRLIERLKDQTKTTRNVFDLTNIIENKPPVFIDYSGHLNQQGNEILATAVANRIKKNNSN